MYAVAAPGLNLLLGVDGRTNLLEAHRMAALPFPSMFARVVILVSATALFGCGTGGTTGGTLDPPHQTVALVVPNPWPTVSAPSPTRLPSIDIELRDFLRECRVERFPQRLTVLPAAPGLPIAAGGPGRCIVTPGRASAMRQSVPSRSRRKVRVWERDAAA